MAADQSVGVAGGRWPVTGGRWPVAGRGRWAWLVTRGRWPAWPVAGVAGGRDRAWPVAGDRWPWPVAGVAGGRCRWPATKNDYSESPSPPRFAAPPPLVSTAQVATTCRAIEWTKTSESIPRKGRGKPRLKICFCVSPLKF